MFVCFDMKKERKWLLTAGCHQRKSIATSFLAIAIDSRLSIAKVRWRQPAVSSEISQETAGCQ